MGRNKTRKRLKNSHRGYTTAMGFGGHGIILPPRRPVRRNLKVVFTATKEASEKVKFWIDRSFGEFSGFAVTADPDDKFTITDFVIVPQAAGGGHADLDNAAIAKYTYKMIKEGLQPWQFSRIWFHTHGGGGYFGPSPSGDDDNTFQRAFAQCSWSAMLIFNNDYSPYMELQNSKAINVCSWKIDFEFWVKPLSKKHQAWADQFDKIVRHETPAYRKLEPIITPAKKPVITTNPQGHTFNVLGKATDIAGRVLSGAEKLTNYLNSAGKLAGMTQTERDYEDELDRAADAEAIEMIARRHDL